MRTKKQWTMLLLALTAWSASAHVPDYMRPGSRNAKTVAYRGVCASSTAQIDLEVNNVRARLLGGGDCWWDFNDGRYIVPKVVNTHTGQKEVSSLFAGGVWIGGKDEAGNLKLACQDYRPAGRNDFWPGPLTEIGVTDDKTCANWDRHFRVTSEEIRKHLWNLANGIRSPDSIPHGVKGWPARGNPFFADVWGFQLSVTHQGFAGFYDYNEDGQYSPLDGDYPAVETYGCSPIGRYPDEMIFWIYNDHGGGAPHARTNGTPIQMEIQVQAFAFATNDELNEMTFYRYKLINRAVNLLESTFFAMWIDPDLGCPLDDYIGCDSTKNLMYVYNQDPTDGQPGCECNGIPTYCDKVPILGVDYFRGPLDEWGDELGMSSFIYFNNPTVGIWPAATTDPQQPFEFFNYLKGLWRDGTPFTYGGNGYDPTSANVTKYAFSSPPNDPNGWSMCTTNLPFGDRRTLQASGPFRLMPGAVNEIIIGIPWVADIPDYPCPDLEPLFRADKIAQRLFEACWADLWPPDKPVLDWIEMNQQVVAVLTNHPWSNNFYEDHSTIDRIAPDAMLYSPDPAVREKTKYKFEGYRIYQLADPRLPLGDLDDPDYARPVYQVDIQNGVSKIFNWEATRDPYSQQVVFFPKLMVDGADQGLRHTFSITEDKFALGNDKRLINHRRYYYTALAYAHNDYETFDPLKRPVSGQMRPYLPSRTYSAYAPPFYTVVPRPIVDRVLNAQYGDGVAITRLAGVGSSTDFLDLDRDSRNALLVQGILDTLLTYREGRGPIEVSIFNPLEVRDGTYEIRFVDDDLADTELKRDTRWELRRLPDGLVVASDRTIAQLNEQIVPEYGFSVTVASAPFLTGSYSWSIFDPVKYPNPGPSNGGIGAEIEYADPNQPWLAGFPDQEFGLFNYVKTNRFERDEAYDPFQGLSTLGNGWFVPYTLCDWVLDPTLARMITPAWTPQQVSLANSVNGGAGEPTDPTSRYYKLANLPSVDIVLTPDTSQWSRCVVVESASRYYTETANEFPKNPALMTQGNPNTSRRRMSFDVRYAPSVGKADADGDGHPDPDGALDANGQPVLGMGWFPGYAVDVITGQRLNVFFGENSCYSTAISPAYTGRDMLWNPTSQRFAAEPVQDYYDLLLGGQHWVYVTYTPYDGCEALRRRLTPELAPSQNASEVFKVNEMRNIAWAGMLMTAPGFQMKPLRDGLVPTETVIKLRVARPFDTWYNRADSGKKNAHPRYQFTIEGREPTPLNAVQTARALDSIKVVPNPYYGYSPYETNQTSTIVKITNLPAKCTVTIYSLSGRFIRQYQRDEVHAAYQQITPDLEWDLKNFSGLPVATGVYILQIQAPGMGERTLKWFGIARAASD